MGRREQRSFEARFKEEAVRRMVSGESIMRLSRELGRSAGGVISLARHLSSRGPGRSGTATWAAATRAASGELEVA